MATTVITLADPPPTTGKYKSTTVPLYHVYLVQQRGSALLRPSRYFSKESFEGGGPAAWEKRNTANYWGGKLNKGEGYVVLRCMVENCPVCRAYWEQKCQEV